MRYNLLPKEGAFYKANLHTHSTITDGKPTPEQIKEEYKNQGYSIVAYTDHEIMIPHNELSDDSFLAITAAEASVKKGIPATEKAAIEKTYHFCLYAKDKTKTVYLIFTEKKSACTPYARPFNGGNAANRLFLYLRYRKCKQGDCSL